MMDDDDVSLSFLIVNAIRMHKSRLLGLQYKQGDVILME